MDTLVFVVGLVVALLCGLFVLGTVVPWRQWRRRVDRTEPQQVAAAWAHVG